MQTLVPSVELYTTRGYLGTELSQAIGMNRNYMKVNWKVAQIDKHDSQECLFHFIKTWSLLGAWAARKTQWDREEYWSLLLFCLLLYASCCLRLCLGHKLFAFWDRISHF